MLSLVLLSVLLLPNWATAAAEPTAVPAQVDLASSIPPQPGRPLNLSVGVRSVPGLQPIPTAAFQVSHEQLLHVVGVGQDLDTFFHWHPTYKTPSVFYVKNAVFPKAGVYLIAVDGRLADGAVANSTRISIPGNPAMSAPNISALAAAAAAAAAAAGGVDAYADSTPAVTVRGIPLMPQQPAVSLTSLLVTPAAARNASIPVIPSRVAGLSGIRSSSSNASNTPGYYTATVLGPQGAACKPGSVATYVWTLTRPVSRYNTTNSIFNLPVNDLRPYYGAPMHLAVVRSDLGYIQHVHGDIVTDSRAGNGSSSSSGSNGSSSSMAAMPHNAGSHASHGRKLLLAAWRKILQATAPSTTAQASMPTMTAAQPGASVSPPAAAKMEHNDGEMASALPARFGPVLKTEVVFPSAGKFLLVGQVSRGNEFILLPVVVSCTG